MVSLARALVDRARTIDQRMRVDATSGDPVRVEGRTQFSQVSSPWFKARLTLRGGMETRTAGRERVRKTPELLFALTDEEGGTVDLDADSLVEVFSADSGSGIYRVNGTPEIMRRRRGNVGGLVTLVRVEEASEPE